MKIAIAICGQVRPYPAPLKKLEKISQSIFADTFIATWNTSGESHKKNDWSLATSKSTSNSLW